MSNRQELKLLKILFKKKTKQNNIQNGIIVCDLYLQQGIV